MTTATDTRKPKILVRYEEIFDKDDVVEGFWGDFFLLKPQTEALAGILRSFTDADFGEHGRCNLSNLRALLEKCAHCVSNETSIAVYNACQTFVTVVDLLVSRFGFARSLQSYFIDAQFCFTAILRRFYFFAVEPVPDELKLIAMQTIERFTQFQCQDADIPQMSLTIFVNAFDVITGILAQETELNNYSSRSIRILATMLARVKVLTPVESLDDPFIKKFTGLNDEVVLQSLALCISEQLSAANEQSACTANSNVLSRITSFFQRRDTLTRSPPREEALDVPCLFVFLETIRFNQAFVNVIIMSRPSLESSNEEKEKVLLLRHFFTYFSLAFEETKSEPGLFAGRLCLLILMRMTDDVFIQNTLHDPHNTCVVPIYRAAMLHRNVTATTSSQIDLQRLPCTLGTTVMELVTELLITHLKIGFPLEFYDHALGVLHRLLVYQRNRCIRMTTWQPVFNAMLSLMKFLATNEKRFSSSIYPICSRIITIVNLFLTFGDAFLPSGEAYDLLYYEMVRQESIFEMVKELLERRIEQGKQTVPDTDWEIAQQTRGYLVNPLMIISKIKIGIDKKGGALEEAQIMEVIHETYETVALRLYDGLTFVRPLDFDCHTPFFIALGGNLLTEALKNRPRDLENEEYRRLVERLSSIPTE